MDCRVCCSPASAERSGPQDSPDPVDLLRLHFDRLGTRVTRVHVPICVCGETDGRPEDSTHNA